MDLKEMRRNWDEFGKTDPLWAILADPGKKGERWDLAEFFESGEAEVASVMEYVDSLHVPLSRDRALDFGCGVGRVTQALCRYFDRCCGVDIASSMIELAEKYNHYEDRCHYYTNTSDDLRLFESDSFDFIYSRLVLQHIAPKYSRRYIKELLRVLAPNGLFIFQLPSRLSFDALPASGFKAQIVVQGPPTSAEPGSRMTIQAQVKNLSGSTWPAQSQVRLGNHWLDEGGNILARDDGRADLPQDLEPMERITIPLSITVPSKPGIYILELDMVQEMVAWFKDKGSQTTRIRLQVGRPLEKEDAKTTQARLQDLRGKISRTYRDLETRLFGVGPTGGFPRIEMYSTPKDEVLDLIAGNGGRVLDIQKDNAAGPGWLDLRYCITKPQVISTRCHPTGPVSQSPNPTALSPHSQKRLDIFRRPQRPRGRGDFSHQGQ